VKIRLEEEKWFRKTRRWSAESWTLPASLPAERPEEAPRRQPTFITSHRIRNMVSPSIPGGPTPPSDDQINGVYATYVPHDLKYNGDFEDSLIHAVLDSDGTANQGVRVIPDDSDEQPQDGVSVRASDISLASLPVITEDDLPLPLNDPRRIFASPVPGIKLTHPGGYLEGGPGLDPDMDTFPEDFFSRNSDVNNMAELRRAVQTEVDEKVEELKERLRARQKAKEKNEQIEKELRALVDQHYMELKIQRRMADEQRAKREAKEKRQKAKEGGG